MICPLPNRVRFMSVLHKQTLPYYVLFSGEQIMLRRVVRSSLPFRAPSRAQNSRISNSPTKIVSGVRTIVIGLLI